MMTASDFIFDCVDKAYYSCRKMTLKTCGSYIKSPEWLGNKTLTINPKSNNDEYIKYINLLGSVSNKCICNKSISEKFKQIQDKSKMY